ncbi:MAG: hypothetical protein M1826_005821, partial [Phylliscum demangeonii]
AKKAMDRQLEHRRRWRVLTARHGKGLLEASAGTRESRCLLDLLQRMRPDLEELAREALAWIPVSEPLQ